MERIYDFTKETELKWVSGMEHRAVIEWLLQDKETKKLYHYVVGYGCAAGLGLKSVFVTHILSKIGVKGTGIGYLADCSKIELPVLPPEDKQEGLTGVVALPEGVEAEDFEFGLDYDESLISKSFSKHPFAKSYPYQGKYGPEEVLGSEIIEAVIGVYFQPLGYIKKKDGIFPFYVAHIDRGPISQESIEYVKDKLSILKPERDEEMFKILRRFAKLDLQKEAREFMLSIGKKIDSLCESLPQSQAIVSEFLFEEGFGKELGTEQSV